MRAPMGTSAAGRQPGFIEAEVCTAACFVPKRWKGKMVRVDSTQIRAIIQNRRLLQEGAHVGEFLNSFLGFPSLFLGGGDLSVEVRSLSVNTT